MSRLRLAIWLAWAGAILASAIAVVGAAQFPPPDLITGLLVVATTVASLSLVGSGAVLLSRLPHNPIGWLLVVGGCLLALANGGLGVATAMIDAGIGGAIWLFWLGAMAWTPAVVVLAVLVPLLFPTGHLSSPRWRVVVGIGLVSIVFNSIDAAISPFAPEFAPNGLSNPTAIGGSIDDVAGFLGSLANLAGVICLPLIAASLVNRYRHAQGIERAQLKWFAAAVALIAPPFAVAIAASAFNGSVAGTVSDAGFFLMTVGLAFLPVAIGIAILRYRLYDIDIIIRRTAVYVPLTAILAGLYAGCTALLQRIFVAATGATSDGAVVMATLILATAFTPVRSWLQGIVDRRFGDVQDIARRLDAFVTQISSAPWTPDPARTLRAFLELNIKLLGASGGVAYLAEPAGETIVGRTGAGRGGTVLAIPVGAAGAAIGRIALEGRRDGRAYAEHDASIAHDAADRLALALLGRPNAPTSVPEPRVDAPPAVEAARPAEVSPAARTG